MNFSLNNFESPFTSPDYPSLVKKGFCFNVFMPEEAKTWNSIEDEKVRFFIALLFDAINDGKTSFKSERVNGVDFYAYSGTQEIPISIQVYELLRDRKKIQAGFRFWFVQNFYELDIGFKIKKVIEDSDRYLHFWDTYMKGRDAKTRVDLERWVMLKKKTNKFELLRDAFISISGRTDLYSVPREHIIRGDFLIDPHSPLNPYRIFDPIDIISRQTSVGGHAIRDVQTAPLSYYKTILSGLDGTFKSFPFPDDTYRIYSESCTYSYLSGSFLPNVMMEDHQKLMNENKVIDELISETQKLIENKRTILDTMTTTENYDPEEVNKIQDLIGQEEANLENFFQQRRDNDGKLTEIQDNPDFQINFSAAVVDEVEMEVMKKNEFRLLGHKNLEKIRMIRNKHPGGGTKYDEEMEKFWRSATSEFWNVFLNADNVSEPTKAARFYLKQAKPSELVTEASQKYSNMSTYANFRILLHSLIEAQFGSETNHSIVMTVFLVLVNSGIVVDDLDSMTDDQQANYLLGGLPGFGKSYAIKKGTGLAFKGSYINSSFSTKKHLTVDKNLDDLARVSHEASLSELGVNEQGMSNGSDSLLKTQMTEGKIITDSIKIDEKTKKRIEDRIVTPACFANIRAHNLESNLPMVDRYLAPNLLRYIRTDRTSVSNINRKLTEEEKDVMDDWLKLFRLVHIYAFIWMKMEQSRCCPPIDMSCFNDVCALVFDKMKGTKRPSDREMAHCRRVAKSMTMLYGVYMEFFSELGEKHRYNDIKSKDKNNADKDADDSNQPKSQKIDPSKRYRKLTWVDFIDLFKWGVCPEEIAIDILTLLEPCLLPALKRHVLYTIGVNMCQYDSTKKPEEQELKKLRFMKKDKELSSLEPSGDSTSEFDYRYLELELSTVSKLAAQIASYMSGNGIDKVSERDIKKEILSSEKEFIESSNYYLKPKVAAGSAVQDENQEGGANKNSDQTKAWVGSQFLDLSKYTLAKDSQKTQKISKILFPKKSSKEPPTIAIAIDAIPVQTESGLTNVIKEALSHCYDENRECIIKNT